MLLSKHNITYKFLLVLVIFPIISLAQCTLPLNIVSWTKTYGTTVTSDIVITVPILVDSPNIVAQGVTLNSGGQLYFDKTIATITLSANWIQIGSNAGLYIGSESCPYTQKANIVLTGQGDVNAMFGGNFIGLAAGGTLELHGARGLSKSWTKLVKTAAVGATSIQVLDSISWQVGDQIVITTTDFSPVQSEVVTITSLSGNTVTFSPPLQWSHYGLITQNVDERAEVGLLTRNIHIYGYPRGTYYGGHLMATRGFLQLHIEGVEFSNMGQDQIARYPVHFHMCGVVPAGTYVRYNSIHDTNFRCITIHGSHGVLLEGNVAYKNYGHCYFLEDGIEVNNTIRGNLAVLTQPKDFGQRIGSDASNTGLSSYWITNPQNTIENNVAAGSYTAGFWIITRLGAAGVSGCVPQYENLPYRVANLPLTSFFGNSAHSCSFGLGIESTNWDAGDVPAQPCSSSVANWEPRNPDNSIPYTYFRNFTAHHIRDRGLWARMPNIVAIGGRFADNYESVEYATSGDMPPYASQQIIQDSIIVGFSDNKGNKEPTTTWQVWDTNIQSSVPAQGNTPTNGIKIYDGPQVIINTVFINFPTVAGRPQDSAIGARLADQSQVATTNYLKNVQFINVGKSFAVMDNTMDGGITGNFRDTDGSVSGYASATVLRNFPYYQTSGCVAKDAFGLVCPHRYAQLWVMDMTSNGAGNNMIITRTNYPSSENSLSHSLTFLGFLSGPSYRYQPIVSLGANYLIRFQKIVSPSLVLQLNNAEQNDFVSIAVCYPLGTVINSVQRGFANYYGNPYPILQQQSSVTTISATGISSSSDSYTYDVANSILYLRLQQRNARTDYGNFCPDSGCDWLWINARFTISATARDCSGSYSSSSLLQNLLTLTASGSWLDLSLTPAAPLPSVLNSLLGIAGGLLGSGNPVSATTAPVSATTKPVTAATTAPVSATSKPVVVATAKPAVIATPAAFPPTSKPATIATVAATIAQPVVSTSCTIACAADLSCCGASCYSPSIYQCNGNKLCTLGLSSCGNDCYIPTKYVCNNGQLAPVL